jgi:hypothetical protein
MTFCFARWRRHGADGYEPDLPEGAAFLSLAEPGRSARWGVFAVSGALDDVAIAALSRVPPKLDVLLHSGQHYPPALALARDDMNRAFTAKQPTRLKFVAVYSAVIRAHLRRQARAPYRLAQVEVDETGYLAKGEFVWVLRYDPQSREVYWVSDDFHVYRNPAKHFRLSRAMLKDLTLRKARR